MSLFTAPDYDNHEQVVFTKDRETGLRAIIAIHNTTLGPALGGLRIWNYGSEAEALRDVLRLSRGMTYKAAAAGVRIGGGKAVIIADKNTPKTPELIAAMARAIDRLNGQYITGPDIGTSEEDMTRIHEVTKYVIGVSERAGGYGDPSISTARGVLVGMKAAAAYTWGKDDLTDVKVAVQGLGHVGFHLCRYLHDAGAKLTVADIKPENVKRAEKELGARSVYVDEIYDADVDIFAPCAFGAVINDQTLPRLKAKIVAGAANNQLDQDRHGAALQEKGIIYLPDYVVNGAGLIRVSAEWYREDPEKYNHDIDKMYDTLLNILKRAEKDGIPTNVAADRIAEERFQQV